MWLFNKKEEKRLDIDQPVSIDTAHVRAAETIPWHKTPDIPSIEDLKALYLSEDPLTLRLSYLFNN